MLDFCADGRTSGSVARSPDIENEHGKQRGDDQHPVLALETQKAKILDQELHRTHPDFYAE
jgi:hypothetical protein